MRCRRRRPQPRRRPEIAQPAPTAPTQPYYDAAAAQAAQQPYAPYGQAAGAGQPCAPYAQAAAQQPTYAPYDAAGYGAYGAGSQPPVPPAPAQNIYPGYEPPNPNQKRRWPWFLLGLAVGLVVGMGGCASCVGDHGPGRLRQQLRQLQQLR